MLFILENVTMNFQMDAIEFEGLLYNMWSEEPFANYRLDMTDENEEYTSCGTFQRKPTNDLPFHPYHHLKCNFLIRGSNNL